MGWEENGQFIEYKRGSRWYRIYSGRKPTWNQTLVFAVNGSQPYRNACGNWPVPVNGGKHWALEPVMEEVF